MAPAHQTPMIVSFTNRVIFGLRKTVTALLRAVVSLSRAVVKQCEKFSYLPRGEAKYKLGGGFGRNRALLALVFIALIVAAVSIVQHGLSPSNLLSSVIVPLIGWTALLIAVTFAFVQRSHWKLSCEAASVSPDSLKAFNGPLRRKRYILNILTPISAIAITLCAGLQGRTALMLCIAAAIGLQIGGRYRRLWLPSGDMFATILIPVVLIVCASISTVPYPFYLLAGSLTLFVAIHNISQGRPALAIVLGQSSERSLILQAKIQHELSPLRVISLLNRDIDSTNSISFLTDAGTFRSSDDAWQGLVQALIDVVPLVVCDLRGLTPHLECELQMLSSRRHANTVIWVADDSLGTINKHLDAFLAASRSCASFHIADEREALSWLRRLRRRKDWAQLTKGSVAADGGEVFQEYHLAIAYQKAGRLREAEEIYRTLATQPSLRMLASAGLARILASTGRHSEAERLCRGLIAEGCLNGQVLYELGFALRQAGRTSESAEVLASVERGSVTDYAMVLWLKGETLYSAGRIDEGFRTIEEAIDEDPFAVSPSLQLVELLTFHGQYQRAIAAAESAIKYHPENPRLRLGLGSARFYQKDYSFADVAFSIAEELGGTTAETLRWRAEVANSLDRPSDALRLLERALALSKDDPETLDTQARVLGGLQQWESAVEVSRLALAISPNENRQYSLAFWLYKFGATEESLSLVEDLIKRETANEKVSLLHAELIEGGRAARLSNESATPAASSD